MRCPYAQNRYCVHAGNFHKTKTGRRLCPHKCIANCPLIKDHVQGKKIIEILLGPLETSVKHKPEKVSIKE